MRIQFPYLKSNGKESFVLDAREIGSLGKFAKCKNSFGIER